jgi:hypothetical protein
MTIVDERPQQDFAPPAPAPVTVTARTSRLRRWRRRLTSETSVVFFLAFVGYTVVAVLLDFKYHDFPGDAVSRTADAYYVIFSRDPHLAAVGFVWNPLPSIVTIVPLLFNGLWAPLVTHNMAGCLVTVACMSGACYQILSCLREWGVGRGTRLLLVTLFALNPMIVYYAGNGMSEAMFVFTLVTTTRHLMRWMRAGDMRSLITSGIWLGLAYLTRYESVGPMVIAPLLVFGVSRQRALGTDGATRSKTALSDAVVFAFPAFVSFVCWAITSWVIVGHPFEQFSSQYGNSAQLVAQGALKTSIGYRLGIETESLLYVAPLLALVAVLLLVWAFARRLDALVLAPIAVIGGALGFSLVSFLANKTGADYRYYIAAVPLEVLLVGGLIAGVSRGSAQRVSAPSPITPGRSLGTGLATAVIALVLIGPSLPTAAAGFFNARIVNGGDAGDNQVGYIFHRHLDAIDRANKPTYQGVLDIGSYIDRMHLPEGDVVVDTFTSCIPFVYLTVANSKVFVVTSDRDFQQVLSDPLTFHARYLLVPNPALGLGKLEEINKTYGSLWATGAGFATLAHQFPKVGGCPELRLYRVVGHPPLR